MASAKVRMRVLIEMDVGGTYGKEWRLDDVLECAKRDGITALRNISRENHGKGPERFTIIDEPTVIAVIVPDSQT